MANPDFPHLASVTLQNYANTLEDNIFTRREFMAYIGPKRSSYGGGRSIVKQLEVGENDTVRAYNGYDTLPCKPQEGVTSAEYWAAQYSTNISLCGREEIENSGREQLIDLLRQKIQNAENSTLSMFNREFILSGANQDADVRGRMGTAQSGKGVIGLEGLINWKRYPILGGIDANAADCTFWRSFIDDAGYGDAVAAGEDPAVTAPPVPLTLATIYNAIDCLHVEGAMTDVIVASKELFQSIRSFALPNQPQNNLTTANFGFEGVNIMGIPVIWDHNVPADTLYLLDSNVIELKYARDRWMKPTPFREPTNQDARCAYIFNMFQMCTNNRRRLGMICNRKPC